MSEVSLGELRAEVTALKLAVNMLLEVTVGSEDGMRRIREKLLEIVDEADADGNGGSGGTNPVRNAVETLFSPLSEW